MAVCPAAPVARPFSSGVYARSIQQFGGTVADPAAYPATPAGFQEYLSASGVNAVSAAAMIQPHYPGVAARLGFANFLPPRAWWPRGAALALLTQEIDAHIASPARVRNWWRPQAYNIDPKVGGAKNGDHPTANAVDLDYASMADRMRAEVFLRGLERRCPWMQISLGLGAETTHVGIASPRGRREWHYAGWRPATNIKLARKSRSPKSA